MNFGNDSKKQQYLQEGMMQRKMLLLKEHKGHGTQNVEMFKHGSSLGLGGKL